MMQAAIPAPEATVDVEKPDTKPLRPPSRWHDPLKLIEHAAPERSARIVLWTIAVLCLLLIVWACLGQLDIIASAEGKLASQTLLKVVQPSEAGVVKQLLVAEGDSVKAGQVLARLDTTLAKAERSGVQSALASQQMQMRRLQAALQDQVMSLRTGDDAVLFAQVQSQAIAQRRAFADSVEQERALLLRAENELRSAQQILHLSLIHI
jgi:hemolysin D